jgi:hypothetical protein
MMQAERSERIERVKRNVASLIERFDDCIRRFDEKPPFDKPDQLKCHQQTIDRRSSFDSATEALKDDVFLDSLYRTLRAWGIGLRGAILAPRVEFVSAIRKNREQIAKLDGMKIDDPQLDTAGVSTELWQLISSLRITYNVSILVSRTKALHHILPELVVPIDRKYTGSFFECRPYNFQYSQRKFFDLAFNSFALIARSVNLTQYVSPTKWHTSRTKVLDNAIVGFVLLARDKESRI